jgi:hypothetical protein
MITKRNLTGALAALTLVCFAAAANAQPLSESQTISGTSKVLAVDQKERLLTLQNSAGETMVLKVGEVVRNFPQIKVGDMVNVTYTESVTLSLGTPGATPGAASSTTLTRAPEGSMPRGKIVNTLNETVLITAIDKTNRKVTVKAPSGRVVVTKVAPEVTQFDSLKVGDSVDITYTEAMAVSVERP